MTVSPKLLGVERTDWSQMLETSRSLLQAKHPTVSSVTTLHYLDRIRKSQWFGETIVGLGTLQDFVVKTDF